jgi:hypothetical protein
MLYPTNSPRQNLLINNKFFAKQGKITTVRRTRMRRRKNNNGNKNNNKKQICITRTH